MRIEAWGKWCGLGLLVIVVIACLLIVVEFYLRHLVREHFKQSAQHAEQQHNLQIHRRSEDPALVYELTPDASTTRDEIMYQINSQGFRDDDFGAPTALKAKNELRIAVIGDSVAWGWGVEMNEAWPQAMEQQLQMTYPERKVTVYNLAVNGYSTQQEVRTLESKGLAYKPDIVILNYALNDPTVEEGGMWPYFAPITRVETWYRIKIIWQGIRHSFLKLTGLLPSPLPRDNPWDYTSMIHGALFYQVESGLQDLVQLQKAHAFTTIVLVTPLFDFKKNEPYPWLGIHELIHMKSKQYGFDYVDAQDYYQGYHSKKLSVDLIHPNTEGHRIIAEAMTSKIISHLHADINL